MIPSKRVERKLNHTDFLSIFNFGARQQLTETSRRRILLSIITRMPSPIWTRHGLNTFSSSKQNVEFASIHHHFTAITDNCSFNFSHSGDEFYVRWTTVNWRRCSDVPTVDQTSIRKCNVSRYFRGRKSEHFFSVHKIREKWNKKLKRSISKWTHSQSIIEFVVVAISVHIFSIIFMLDNNITLYSRSR